MYRYFVSKDPKHSEIFFFLVHLSYLSSNLIPSTEIEQKVKNITKREEIIARKSQDFMLLTINF